MQVSEVACWGVQTKSRKSAAARDVPSRRSPCPVACALDVFGDRWTLLIVRDLVVGRNRFKDFSSSPEGIPTNILSERLERLLAHQIVQQIPSADGTKHLAYALTEKGEALRPLLKAMRNWGLTWEPGTQAKLAAVIG